MSFGYISPMLRKLIATAFLICLLAPPSFSQQNTGSIKGNVTDQLGSLVVGAIITTRDARGVEKKASTNSAGIFEFRSVTAGFYDLKVVAAGFEVVEEKQVEVRSGRATNLDLQLNIATVEQSVTVEEKGVSTDSERNADAVVLRERELEALPSDPEGLAAALQAMAGPTQGEGGVQVKVDGFSNGQIPPKEAIREVRVNQNPYSAENEYPGWGGIEIFTQPGSDKFHGSAGFNFNDESLNSRNPFAPSRAPYQQRSFNASLTGPIKPKRASFSFFAGRTASDSNSVVNARVIEPVTLTPVRFNQTLVTPQVSANLTARGDLKINKKHTVVGSYEYGQFAQDLQGIGGFSLPARAYRGERHYHALQLTETAIINETAINETRLQLAHNTVQQTALTALPALNVLDSFFGGGAQVGSAFNRWDRAELQNFTSWSVGNHFLKVGGRFRYVSVKSVSPSNFGGTYTFGGGTGPLLDANDQVVPGGGSVPISSLERYRRTLVFQRQHLSPALIRSLGGGATQFSIVGGNPEVDVTQSDLSLFMQDEWKLRPNFTISPGFRYETQNNVRSNLNFAPRIGFAWSPLFGSKKKTAAETGSKKTEPAKPDAAAPAPKPAAARQSKTVIRGGFGVFYNRISEDITMQALRFNGLNQRQFVLSDPSVLDLFPEVPAINELDAFALPQTRRFIDPDLAPSYSLRLSLSAEHQLPHNLKLSLNYSHGHSLRTLRTVNINAPLGGTYNPAVPSSGVRPLGRSAGNILEYQSNGKAAFDSFGVNLNATSKKFNAWLSYSFNKNRSSDNGTSGSAFDAYDFESEWGRPQFDTRHFFYANGSYQLPHGFSFNTFIIANSGNPFNITTGRDTNGDTFFTERPAFATDLAKQGVIVTPLGAFDPNPGPNQQIIPRNFGQGPSFFSVNLGAVKAIKFGRAIPPRKAAAAPAGTITTTTVSQPPTTKPPVQRPYQLMLSVYATNLLNHTNRGNPVGNMTSPFFLKSTGSSGIFFFGPGGGGAAGNRQFILRVRLSF